MKLAAGSRKRNGVDGKWGKTDLVKTINITLLADIKENGGQ